jgi:hypothetical protein
MGDDQRKREPDPRRRARRRRALDQVFGDVLPDVTGDDSGDSGGSRPAQGDSDARDDEIRRDVPPHHS